MRILAAPDKFKASLTGLEAAQCMAAGWRSVFPGDAVRLLPIADGGEGTAEIVRNARGGSWVELTVEDPLGRPVHASYAVFEDLDGARAAVLEMSAASGLWRLRREERAPLDASSYGTGQLLAHAARVSGAERIVVGLGGSATNDGGAGLAAALGYRLLDAYGAPIRPSPRGLRSLARIVPPETGLPPVIVACDVKNPLLGERGTTAVYGPQKGVRPADRPALEAALTHWADIVERDLGLAARDLEGAGAAGGLGFGLLAFCRAEMRSGFELVAELVQLESAIAEADFVLTGEGSLDAQTLEGKGPAGVGLLARRLGKRCAAFGGRIVPTVEAELRHVFDAVLPISPGPITFEESIARGPQLLHAATARAARWFGLGRPSPLVEIR